jgi:hypothetical protein
MGKVSLPCSIFLASFLLNFLTDFLWCRKHSPLSSFAVPGSQCNGVLGFPFKGPLSALEASLLGSFLLLLLC